MIRIWWDIKQLRLGLPTGVEVVAEFPVEGRFGARVVTGADSGKPLYMLASCPVCVGPGQLVIDDSPIAEWKR